MFATQVLPELQSVDDSEEENTSEVVGLFVVDDEKFEVRKGETKIGRDSSVCSIVIENFTISKVHAVIESEGIDDTFIYDVGSTNQTKIGKKVLRPYCRYKLDNGSRLVLGNVIAKFILPPDKSLDSNKEADKPNSVNLNSVNTLGDIFDAVTQVTASSSTTSKDIVVFEKQKRSYPIFKIPNVVFSTNMQRSLESLSCFDEVTECKLDVEGKTSRTECHNNLLECSDIFDLSTQCQIYEKSQTEKSQCGTEMMLSDNHKNSESDETKALLNDGQDAVLCTFMSLHSPKSQNSDGSLTEIKVKTEVENFNQELNASAQVQTEIIQEPSVNKEIKISSIIENENLSDNFSNKSSGRSSEKFKLSNPSNACESNDSFTEHIEEDFIRTQEFNVDDADLTKKYADASYDIVGLLQDKETRPCLKKTSVDSSTMEQKSVDEDLILTQAFEILEQNRQNKKTHMVIRDNEDLIANEEDFTATQIYDVEKEKQGAGKKTFTSAFLPGNSNKDVESHLCENLNTRQRNFPNDFISTDEALREESESSEKNDSDNDEDFISTQLVQLPLIKVQSSRGRQEKTSRVLSRESSPDLLDPRNTWRNSEEYITTQTFEMPECLNLKTDLTKFPVQTDSNILTHSETKKSDCSFERSKVPKIIDSSGDETESDLEILFDNSEKGKDRKFLDCTLKSFKDHSELEHKVQDEKSLTPENDSNSSYIFELFPDNHFERTNATNIEINRRPVADLSDSDATDCEDLAIMWSKIPKKEESSNKAEIKETQLNLTLPRNFTEKISSSHDSLLSNKGTPKFDTEREKSPLSQLSLEMPSTQDIETTINSLLRKENENENNKEFETPSKMKKIEVGIKNISANTTINMLYSSGRQIDSPLKRQLNGNSTNVVPSKKPKHEISDSLIKSSDKQFLKLVQAHDIAQIKPGRTRNSVKMLITESNSNKRDVSLGNNIINERPTSRRKTSEKRRSSRKTSGNITPYLITKKMETRRSSYEGKKKEISPKENKLELKPSEFNVRILRRSKRINGNSVSAPLSESPMRNLRKSKRNCKSREYFSGPCVNVVFTGFDCEFLDKIIHDLGGKKTNDLSCGEVVVSDKVRRTVKFLCAIGLSLPITSPQWLMLCKKEKKFLNPWNFILKDEESEEKWDFELRASLEKSKKAKLLKGFHIFATKSTKPPVKDLLAVVECCGGTPLSKPPDPWPKNTIVVSCLEDKKFWPLAKFRNVKIVHYEFILSGVLKQKIDFKKYRLR